MTSIQPNSAGLGPIWQFTEELSSLVYRLYPVKKVRIEIVRKGPDAYISLRYMLERPAVLPSVGWLESTVEALQRVPFAMSCRIHHYGRPGVWPFAGYLAVTIQYPHGQGD